MRVREFFSKKYLAGVIHRAALSVAHSVANAADPQAPIVVRQPLPPSRTAYIPAPLPGPVAPPVKPKPVHEKLDPASAAQLEWISTSPIVRPSDRVSVLELNIWTEGDRKCAEHCWHRLPNNGVHARSVKIPPAGEHGDYSCCRCTHGLCHVGTRGDWLSTHPLTKNHRRRVLPADGTDR